MLPQNDIQCKVSHSLCSHPQILPINIFLLFLPNVPCVEIEHYELVLPSHAPAHFLGVLFHGSTLRWQLHFFKAAQYSIE